MASKRRQQIWRLVLGVTRILRLLVFQVGIFHLYVLWEVHDCITAKDYPSP